MPHHIYRRKGSDNWWLDIKVKGRKRIRRSAGTTEKPKAKALATKIEAQEWERLIKGDPASITFAEAVMMYTGEGKSTNFLAKLVAHFKDTKLQAIKAGHIRAACGILYPNAKPATWNRQVITPTRAVINHAAEKDLAAYIKVKFFSELARVRPIPQPDWLPKFIEAAEPRIAAIALFIRITGARIGQAIELDWSKVDLQRGFAIVPPAKGHPERMVELTPQMVSMLANLESRHTGPVFGYENRWSIYKPWKQACKAAGIPYITTHPAGRKSAMTALQRAGVDVKTAMELTGMKSVRLALGIYTEASSRPGLISEVFGTFESQPPKPETKKPFVIKRGRGKNAS